MDLTQQTKIQPKLLMQIQLTILNKKKLFGRK